MVYLLFCAVAIVWGVVLRKVFFKSSEEGQNMNQPIPKAALEAYNRYETKSDTFNLVLKYRDPFLGTSERVEDVKDEKGKADSELEVSLAPKPSVVWPEIRYNGRIVNPRSKKTVTIMSVNGIETMIEEGQTSGGVKIVKNMRDSILIRWNGLDKFIRQ